MATTVQDVLEEMVDKTSLHEILDMLAAIAYEKEGHILENWQDAALAKTWRQDAAKIANVAIRLHN